jgi:hypothetical protein
VGRYVRPIRESLNAKATTKLLFDTLRYTVIRRNGGSIEIAPKGDPKGTRIFHKRAKRCESELEAAHHRDGFDGVDRLCEQLLAEWPETEHGE